jgi:hypothetical protein
VFLLAPGSGSSGHTFPLERDLLTSWLAERPLRGIAASYTSLDQEDTRCSAAGAVPNLSGGTTRRELAFRLTFYLWDGIAQALPRML